MTESLILSVLLAFIWLTIAKAFDKWGIENKYYMTNFYNDSKFAPPYCMFCASFWFSIIVVIAIGDYHLFAVPLVVPGIFVVIYK